MASAKANAIIERVKTQGKYIASTAKGHYFGHCFIWASVKTSPCRCYKVCIGGACLAGEEFQRVEKEIRALPNVESVWINID